MWTRNSVNYPWYSRGIFWGIKWLPPLIFVSFNCAAVAQKDSSGNRPIRKQEQKKDQASEAASFASQNPARTEAPSTIFSMAMLERNRIDPSYKGFPVEAVIEAIEKLQVVKKGEFESTADYNARRDAALSRKFLHNVSVEDVFAFVAPISKISKFSNGIAYQFDADTSEVKLYALPQSHKYLSLNGIGAPDYQINRRESKGLDQFGLSTKIESNSKYQGSNAYGATVTVEKTSMLHAGIAANRIPFLRFERNNYYTNPTVSAQFRMENSKAAAELPVMKALIVMKLSAPFVLYNFHSSKPTLDSPTEILMQEKFLTGDVLGIVYYSGKTGEIFARLPESLGKPETKADENIVGAFVSSRERPSSSDNASVRVDDLIRTGERRAAEGGAASSLSGPASISTSSNAPFDDWVARVTAAVRENTNYFSSSNLADVTQALFRVSLLPDCTLTRVERIDSSGVPSWDQAAERAIRKTATFPKFPGGGCPRIIELGLRPQA